MPKAADKLSPKQERMIDYYFGVSNLNKTDAMRRAGYAHPNDQLAVFTYPNVAAEIERRQEVFREKYNVTYEGVEAELMKIAKSNLLDYIEVGDDGGATLDLTKATAAELAAIGEIIIKTHWEDSGEVDKNGKKIMREVTEVKVKPWNKLTALDAVMRHAGLSKDKLKVEAGDDLVKLIQAGRERVRKK